MNREIKFRAWNIQNKLMYQNVQDGLLAENEKGQLVLGVSLGKLSKDVGSVLMQFSGLQDKNGKEIYEGDIVKWGMHPNSQEFYHRYSVVKINPDIQFSIIYYLAPKTRKIENGNGKVFHFGSFAYKDTENHLEVIGNIYENPELLDGSVIA